MTALTKVFVVKENAKVRGIFTTNDAARCCCWELWIADLPRGTLADLNECLHMVKKHGQWQNRTNAQFGFEKSQVRKFVKRISWHGPVMAMVQWVPVG